MRSSYPKKEQVYVIDSGEYIGNFIFPSYASEGKIYQNVSVVIVGGMKGSRDPLIKAYETADRTGPYKLVNVFLIPGYSKQVVDVPADVLESVEEYNKLFPKYQANQLNDMEELDNDLYTKMLRLSKELYTYFEK